MELPEYKSTKEELGVYINPDDININEFYEKNIFPYIHFINEWINNSIMSYNSNVRIDRYQSERINMLRNCLDDIIADIKFTKNPMELIYLLSRLQFLTDGMISIENSNQLNTNINKMIDFIEKYLSEKGFRYFQFFKNDSYMYRINVDKSKIRFDISESGFSTPDSKELAKKAFDHLKNAMETNMPMINFRTKILYADLNIDNITDYIGWSRDELINALSESEYFKEDVSEVQIIGNWGNVITKYMYKYPYFGARYTVNSKRKLPIFEYISRSKLELIYKHINNYNHINFHALCKAPNIDTKTFYRMLDKFDPTFMKGKYKNLTIGEICDELGTESIRASMLEIPQLSQDIIYQPGGKYHKRTGVKHKIEGYEKVKDWEMRKEYKKYLNNCEDPDISTQSIIFDAIELGLVNIINRNMTRDQICGVIRKYLEKLYGDIEYT